MTRREFKCQIPIFEEMRLLAGFLQLFLLAFVAGLARVASGDQGYDFSTAVSTTSLQCLKDSYNAKRAIARGYMSSAQVDPNLQTNLANMNSVAFENIDVYMFPCASCESVEDQITQLATALMSYNLRFDKVWLDLEIYKTWSTTNLTRNA